MSDCKEYVLQQILPGKTSYSIVLDIGKYACGPGRAGPQNGLEIAGRDGPKIFGPCTSLAETYLRAKFHLDPSNHLATIRQRHRQTGQTARQDNGPIA